MFQFMMIITSLEEYIHCIKLILPFYQINFQINYFLQIRHRQIRICQTIHYNQQRYKKEMRRIQSHDANFFDFNQEIGEELINETKEHQFLREVFEAVYLPNQSFQTFRERIRQHRNYLQTTNLHGYSYSRAHHYHFFLQEFPRIPGQPTYALDLNNSFRSTFSQQQKLYKGDRLGSILNRVAFTLPKRQQYFDLFGPKKRGGSHNMAHDQLFSIQNSKINLDRELLTCRMILKNLQDFTQNYRLWQFELLKERSQLEFLLDETLPMEDKNQKLQNHIVSLQERKANMIPIWQANDDMFLFSSLQQKLHDRIAYEQNLQVIQVSNRIQFYINKHKNLIQSLTKQEVDLDQVIAKIFCFFNTKVAAITETQIEILKAHNQKINKPMKTALPMLIFDYGKLELREKVNRVIARFMENREISIDQECTATLNRLFRGTFEINDLSQEISSYEAKVMTKKVRNRLKRQMEMNKDRVVQTPILDDYINQTVLNESTADRQSCLPILNISQYKVQICEQQMQMFFYYNNLCKAVSLFEPLIYQDQSVMKVLCSPYLDHLLHGIIGHIPIKIIGQLINNLRHLIEHAILSNCIKQTQVFTDFYWEYNNETGVGIVWSEPKKPSLGKNLSHFYSIMKRQDDQEREEEHNDGRQQKQQHNDNRQQERQGNDKRQKEEGGQKYEQQLGNSPRKLVKQNEQKI